MKKKNGFFLIEAVIAIIIFAVGIVGVIQYQNTVLQSTADAYNRITATYLAESIIGQITIDQANIANYTNAVTSHTGYANWLNMVTNSLPKAATNLPTITSTTVNGANQLTISIYWENPFDNIVSSYTTQAVIF